MARYGFDRYQDKYQVEKEDDNKLSSVLTEHIQKINNENDLIDDVYESIKKAKVEEHSNYLSIKQMIDDEKETYVKKNTVKKGKSMAREMRGYIELVEDSLYDEVFEVLEKNASEIEDSIERKRYIRSIFNGLFDDEVFSTILHENKWGELASAMSIALERPFFSDIKNRFGTVLNVEEASKLVSVLLLENKIEAAATFMVHANKDLSIYSATLEGVISSNNVKALRFICENFENIHFNANELLLKAANTKPEALRMLIDEFEFDINTQNRLDKSLVTTLISENNVKNFDWLNKNYPDKINYGNESIFRLIEKGNKSDFYSVILGNQSLKLPQLEKIAEFLFNPKNIEKYSQTDLYEKLFLHKKFDDQVFNLGQEYLLYGLFSKMGIAAKMEGDSSARNYLRIIDTYLNSTSMDTIPDSIEYHIVGVAVHVAKLGDSQSTTDACSLILRRFGKYINIPNPSGLLPIQQVEKDSPLYCILLNNGAVPPEPPATFWTSVLNVFKGKKETNGARNVKVAKAQQDNQELSSKSSIGAIRVKMRNDFRTMQEYLTVDECDSVIKMKCENMFLKADKLSMVMEKNSLTSFTDEFHFLSENFSNYLKQSLKAYTDLVHTTQSLDNVDQSQVKIERAKKMCMNHVDLLNEQLELIINNISNGLSDDAMSQLKVRSKFLEERFNSTIVDDSKEENIVKIMSSKKSEKNESVEKKVAPIIEPKESSECSAEESNDLKSKKNKSINVLEYKSEGDNNLDNVLDDLLGNDSNIQSELSEEPKIMKKMKL